MQYRKTLHGMLGALLYVATPTALLASDGDQPEQAVRAALDEVTIIGLITVAHVRALERHLYPERNVATSGGTIGGFASPPTAVLVHSA